MKDPMQDYSWLGLQEPPGFTPYNPGTGLFKGGYQEPERFQMDDWGNILPTTAGGPVPLQRPEVNPNALGPMGIGFDGFQMGAPPLYEDPMDPRGAGAALFSPNPFRRPG